MAEFAAQQAPADQRPVPAPEEQAERPQLARRRRAVFARVGNADDLPLAYGTAQRARLTLLSRRKSTAESTLEHAKLVDAIRQGDSRLARETLENHRRRGIQNLTELMAQEQNVLRLL